MTSPIKVFLFHDFPSDIQLPGYDITVGDPFREIDPGRHFRISDFVSGGRDNYYYKWRLYSAAGVDKLYRQRDPVYMQVAARFVEQVRDYDILVLANYNPLHPEILFHELKKPVKILGFIDDPFSSYSRGVPYLWAVDGAFYISPTYDEHHSFANKMHEWGVQESMWWPLVPHPMPRLEPTEAFFRDRDIDVLYVGNAYGAKIDRLVQLRKRFGARFRIQGRWPFAGYHGIVRGLFGKPILWTRVQSVTLEERTALYAKSKIGINMHMSEVPRESGNMRMYEVPAHGAMLLCDKAGLDGHEKIFSPGAEAIYYEDVHDAIARIEFFLSHDEERVQIAKGGYQRFWTSYEWSKNLHGLLNWALTLRNTRRTHQ